MIKALAESLEANFTTVKNALEQYMANNGGVAMSLTDAYGKTSVSSLPLGLYLCVETAVPEMVVSTTDPFLVSLPMTSVNGTNADDGGTRWIYDVTLYPKNLTGIPSLEKTLRENYNDTGNAKHNGSATDITDACQSGCYIRFGVDDRNVLHRTGADFYHHVCRRFWYTGRNDAACGNHHRSGRMWIL